MADERDAAEEPLDEGTEVEGAREEPRDPGEDEGEATAQDSPAEGDTRPEGLEPVSYTHLTLPTNLWV